MAFVRLLGVLLVSGCATIPQGQYGVQDIEWKGVEQMSDDALEACLATRERERVTMRLGFGSPECGKPPFDSSPPSVGLWSWPWSEWPVYDPAILGVDRERILRWYAARGYYETEITRVSVATTDGETDPGVRCEDGDCAVAIEIELQEGEPVTVTAVNIVTGTTLDAELRTALERAPRLTQGVRFDEATYEADKRRLRRVLRGAGHARAKVGGEVVIDRGRRSARIEYRVDPGPACVFGEVRVQESEDDDIPSDLIIQAAAIPKGEPYDAELVEDAQRAVFALGVFSSVELEESYPGDGRVVDLVVKAEVGRLVRPSAGLGVMSGTLRRATSDEVTSVPQWDVHLRVAYEHRNFLGGLRRLRIEERPRLIFLDDFPQVPGNGPALGNVLSLTFEQPSTFEARTVLFSENEWDLGPDAFYGYFRHDVALKLGLRRSFFKQRLYTQLAIQHDFYQIADNQVPDTVSSYRLPFVEQQVRLDLRDDARRPKLGLYAAVTTQEALRLGGWGSWDYLRVLPEVRAYAPVFFDVVIAARFAVGALFVLSADDRLDDTSARLGPQSYRLRGGGANSNRGFRAGELGAGIDGGKRRYEASLELRVPLGSDLGVVAFGDIGDVSRGSSIRFGHLNTAAGLGLRYYTVFGAVRLDAAWRIPGLQRTGADPEPVELGIAPSALHLTIGEAF